jgi:hypothetical protein
MNNLLPDSLLEVDQFEIFADALREIEEQSQFLTVPPELLAQSLNVKVEPLYEFDCPKFFDLEKWAQKFEVLGAEAYEETDGYCRCSP